MSNILHNPENDSYGFRISYRVGFTPEAMRARLQAAARVDQIEAYCNENFDKDDWYLFSHWNGVDKLRHHDFWFINRDMAITTRLLF